MTDEKGMASELRVMAKTLKELQLIFEPIRDKALDEKARLTGYAQCAEQMISVIVAKMADFEKKAATADALFDKAQEVVIEEVVVEEVVSESNKSGRKKKVAKQENTQ